jgi:hypothetical protein
MVSRLALVALLLCGLAACQSGGAGSSKALPTYTGRLPEASPVKLQRLTDGGDYVHRDTGLVFPERLGDLARESISIATENEDDVGASYMIPGRQDFLGTAMVFPVWNVVARRLSVDDVPDACEDGYLDARNTARQRLTNPRVVKEETIANPQFKDAIFTRVIVFEADGGANLAEEPIRSELYWQCGIGKVWVVMHRVSYIAGMPDAAAFTNAVVTGAPRQP